MRQLQMGLRQSLKHQRYQHLFLNQQKIEKPWGYLEAQSRCYQNVDLTEKVFVFGREASDHLINPKLMSKHLYGSLSRRCFTIEQRPNGSIVLMDESQIGVTISDTIDGSEEFLGKGHEYPIYDGDIISLGSSHMVYMFKASKETNIQRKKRRVELSMLDETSTEAPVEPQLSGVEPLPTSPEEPLMEKKIMDKMDKIRKMQSKVPIFKRLLPKAPEPQEQEVGQSAPEKSSGESSQSFPSMINTSQDQEKEKNAKKQKKNTSCPEDNFYSDEELLANVRRSRRKK